MIDVTEFELDEEDKRLLGLTVHAAVDDTMRRGIEAAALWLTGRIQKEIQRGTRSGFLYRWRGAKPGEEPDSFRRINGRVVPVKMRAVPHRASAPGEMPKTDEGELVSHFAVMVDGRKTEGAGQVQSRLSHLQTKPAALRGRGRIRDHYQAFILNDAPHAQMLETKPPHMGGRPFMRQGAEGNLEGMRRIVQIMVNRMALQIGRSRGL